MRTLLLITASCTLALAGCARQQTPGATTFDSSSQSSAPSYRSTDSYPRQPGNASGSTFGSGGAASSASEQQSGSPSSPAERQSGSRYGPQSSAAGRSASEPLYRYGYEGAASEQESNDIVPGTDLNALSGTTAPESEQQSGSPTSAAEQQSESRYGPQSSAGGLESGSGSFFQYGPDARSEMDAISGTALNTAPSSSSAIDDEIVVRLVTAALLAEPTMEPFDIQVSSVEGNVTLSGLVASPTQADKATGIAETVVGVKQVENDLDVTQ